MEYRRLGASGLKVPALAFGAGTFGGSGPLFGAWGTTDAKEARRLVDICLEAGVNLFDTADVYSGGASEEVLGEAIRGRRDAVLLSTKTSLPMGDGPNDAGSSRWRLMPRSRQRCAASAPTTSTCCSCTPSTPARRSRKCWQRSISSCARASCAMSACPTSPAGR